MGELTVLDENAGITAVGWELPELSESDGINGLKALKKIDHARQWWLGDLWNATKWGDGRAACKEVGIPPNSAEVAGYVCRKIQTLRRRKDLSFKHHREVCPIEDESIQDKFLDCAEEYKWSTRTLRDLVEYFRVTGNLVFDKDALGDKVEKELSDYDEKAVVGERTDDWIDVVERIEKLIFVYRDGGWKRMARETVRQDIKVFWNIT